MSNTGIPQLLVGPYDSSSLIMSDSIFTADSITTQTFIGSTGTLGVTGNLYVGTTSVFGSTMQINSNLSVSGTIDIGPWKLQSLGNDLRIYKYNFNTNIIDLMAVLSTDSNFC